jgi:predicted transcriptional regulator
MSTVPQPETAGREAQLAMLVVARWQAEIERAIDHAKSHVSRSPGDREFREDWYRAAWWRTHPSQKAHRFATDEQTDAESVNKEVVWDERTRRQARLAASGR